MIPKVTLKQLFKDTFKRSTLISIPDISELLVVDESMFTKWEVFHSIVRDALKTFEYHYPLCRIQRMYLELDPISRSCTLSSNFNAYLKGIIGEDQIVLMPSAIVGLNKSAIGVSTAPLRNFRYNPPELKECYYASGTYFANCICRRPFPEIYNEVTGEPTDECAVYWLMEDVNSQYSIFRDELYLCVCRYLLNLKKNMSLQNLPIDLFLGLEEDMNKLEGKQEQIYQTALTHSYWLV